MKMALLVFVGAGMFFLLESFVSRALRAVPSSEKQTGLEARAAYERSTRALSAALPRCGRFRMTSSESFL